MNVILGFGPAHTERTKAIVRALDERTADLASEEEVRTAVKAYQNELGTFEGREHWRVLDVHPHFLPLWGEHYIVVIEGTVNHYRNDHPLSPDGYAMLGERFCITQIDDGHSDKRTYLSF